MRVSVTLYAVAFGLAGLAADLGSSGPFPPFHPSFVAVDLGPDASHALLEADSRLLAGVALGEDQEAAIAVIWTVINRAKGRPLLEAITEGQAYGTMIRGQFRPSWSLRPYDRWRHPLSHAALHRLEGIAMAIQLGYIPDPTGGATHFHRVGTWIPWWAPDREEWEQYGQHVFYKSEEAM